MLQHHKGKVYTLLKKTKTKQNKQKNKKHTPPHTHTQLTPCVLDAELDCFEDFNPKKKILSQ